MTALLEAIQLVQQVVFICLGVVAIAHWWRRRGAAAAWLAATFTNLAAVVIAGRLLPDDTASATSDLQRKALVAVLILFPYLLYRFMRTFLVHPTRWIFWYANTITAGLVVWTFLLREFPSEGEPRSSQFNLYLVGFLLQWTSLLLMVAFRLWRYGRAQPPVARTRMRLLGLGAVGLAIALLISGTMPADNVDTNIFDIVTAVLGLASGPLFVLGFAPPGFVRTLWRQRALADVHSAELALMETTTIDEVAGVVLPQAATLMGSRAAVIASHEGEVIASHGVEGEEAAALARRVAVERRGPDLLTVAMRQGLIGVEATPYTPFFGREETELLGRFAVLTELAIARAELLERERHALDQLVDAQALAHIGSWEWDFATGTATWSRELYRIYGVDPETFTPDVTSLVEFMHPDDREVGEAEFARAQASGEPFSYEMRIIRRDGSLRVLHARGTVVVDESGEPIKAVGTLQDITERKIEEEARDQFIANAAHELRTPMTTMLGFVQVLESRRDDLPPEQANQVFAAANRAGERLRALVDNMLNLTRLQQHKASVPVERVEIAPIVEDALAIAPPPEGKHVEVRCAPDLAATANRDRLEQIVSNLLTNSYRYGGVNILVAAGQAESKIRVEVSDDGPGVEEALIPHLFEPFTRGATSSDVGGSGLGLAIAKRLAEANRGDLRYEGTPGSGARFVIELEPAA